VAQLTKSFDSTPPVNDFGFQLLEDGVSWYTPSRYYYTDEYIEENHQEWEWAYLKKWSGITGDSGFENGAVMVSKAIDALWSYGDAASTGYDTETRLVMNHRDPNAYFVDPAVTIKDAIYKVLHSGISLVVGSPLYVILSYFNKHLNDNMTLVSKGL